MYFQVWSINTCVRLIRIICKFFLSTLLLGNGDVGDGDGDCYCRFSTCITPYIAVQRCKSDAKKKHPKNTLQYLSTRMLYKFNTNSIAMQETECKFYLSSFASFCRRFVYYFLHIVHLMSSFQASLYKIHLFYWFFPSLIIL